MKSFATVIAVVVPMVQATTCGQLKSAYRNAQCCSSSSSGDSKATVSFCGSASATSEFLACDCLGTSMARMKDNYELNVLGTLSQKNFEEAWGNFTALKNRPADYGLDCGYHGDTKRWCYMAKASKDSCSENWDFALTSEMKNTAMEKDLYWSYGRCGDRRLQDTGRRLATSGQQVTCSALKNAYEASGCCGAIDGKTAAASACCECAGDMLERSKSGFVSKLYKATAGSDYKNDWKTFVTGVEAENTDDYGLTCGDHDKDIKTCKPGGTAAGKSWCDDSWCYSTNDACPGSTKTTYFANTSMEKLLTYSYTHCKAYDKLSCSSICPASGSSGSSGSGTGTGGSSGTGSSGSSGTGSTGGSTGSGGTCGAGCRCTCGPENLIANENGARGLAGGLFAGLVVMVASL